MSSACIKMSTETHYFVCLIYAIKFNSTFKNDCRLGSNVWVFLKITISRWNMGSHVPFWIKYHLWQGFLEFQGKDWFSLSDIALFSLKVADVAISYGLTQAAHRSYYMSNGRRIDMWMEPCKQQREKANAFVF